MIEELEGDDRDFRCTRRGLIPFALSWLHYPRSCPHPHCGEPLPPLPKDQRARDPHERCHVCQLEVANVPNGRFDMRLVLETMLLLELLLEQQDRRHRIFTQTPFLENFCTSLIVMGDEDLGRAYSKERIAQAVDLLTDRMRIFAWLGRPPNYLLALRKRWWPKYSSEAKPTKARAPTPTPMLPGLAAVPCAPTCSERERRKEEITQDESARVSARGTRAQWRGEGDADKRASGQFAVSREAIDDPLWQELWDIAGADEMRENGSAWAFRLPMCRDTVATILSDYRAAQLHNPIESPAAWLQEAWNQSPAAKRQRTARG